MTIERVWVIEHGDYEARMVWGVAASVDAAVASVKADYPEPYVVRWRPVEGSGDSYSLEGDFDAVLHYSTKHVGIWDITAHEVVT